MKYLRIIVLFLQVLGAIAESKEFCENKLNNCTSTMQSVLNEIRYMFPISQVEIESMCKIWSQIMDCIRNYVDDCSSQEQRSKFNEAVSNSIDSVHAICSSERYRRDYLEYANCYRKISMESCERNFRKLVDSAYDPHSSEVKICCDYRNYEKCVSEPIQRMCGPQALHILDDSMSSFKYRCEPVMKSSKSIKRCLNIEEDLLQEIQPSNPRPALRHADQGYDIFTNSYYESREGFSTLAWTPRTVIYPLPVTRHRSRMSRSCGIWNCWPDYKLFIVISATTLFYFMKV